MDILIGALAAAVLIVILFIFKIRYPKDEGQLKTSLEKEAKKLVRRDPNFRLAIGVIKDGETYLKCFGASPDIGDTNETTVFQIGSLSKLFTAETFERLVENGTLSHTHAIADIIGHHHSLDPRVASVTLSELASHTSGFPKDPKDLIEKVKERSKTENIMKDPFSYLSAKDIFSYLKKPDDLKKRGKFEYSNLGMGLLGHLMEHQTGQTLDALAKTYVLGPLNMNDTTIALDELQKNRLIQGYNEHAEPTPPWSFGALHGAGAFHSTLRDITYFLEHHLHSSTKTGWMRPTAFDLFFGNEKICWHNGQVGGYSSYLAVHQEKKFGLAILTNRSFNTAFFGMILTRIVRSQSWRKK